MYIHIVKSKTGNTQKVAQQYQQFFNTSQNQTNLPNKITIPYQPFL